MAKFKQVITETKSEFYNIKGKSKWAKVLEPSEYGTFEIDLYPSQEDLTKYIGLFETIVNDAQNEVEEKGKVIKGVADVFKEDNDGNKYFKVKLPATKADGTANTIKFYNVFGKEEKEFNSLIGNDSDICVRVLAKPYYMSSTKQVGVSLKFYAVQIINLKEYGGATFEDMSGDTSTDTDDGDEDAPF